MFDNREGQRVPEVVFKTREGSDWVEVSSSDVFNGKNVIVFSLPGAFTPTCSSSHVPRYNELADLFAAQGIDEIICVAVNDVRVMEHWGRTSGAEEAGITMLADWDSALTKALGLEFSAPAIGFS